MLMKLEKKTVVLVKPIYAGISILDLSKLHMYVFHYNTIKPKYGSSIRLLMTDTNSLVYRIETEDYYKNMYEMKEYFDMSEYSTINPIYDITNKKAFGNFKDETGDCVPSLFIGVRSKVYTMCADKPLFYNGLTEKEHKSLMKKKLLKKLKHIPRGEGHIPKAVVKKQIDLFADYVREDLNAQPARDRVLCTGVAASGPGCSSGPAGVCYFGG